MKYLLVLFLLIPMHAIADDTAWEVTPDGLIMQREIADKSATNWDNSVGGVTGLHGVHTHHYGLNSCAITQRTAGTIKMHDCTMHLNGPVYEFNSTTFPQITSIDIDAKFTSLSTTSLFIGVTMSNYTIQDTFFTDTDVDTAMPLARVQKTLDGGLSIIDERNIISAVDKKDFRYRRGAIGSAVSLDGGLVPTKTGTRNINLSAGSFYDSQGEEHILPAYNLLSTIPLWRTTGALTSWTTTGKDVFQMDNIYYNNVGVGGLVAATNNNKYIYQLIACSPEGGTIRGVDTGRKPTCFSFYGPAQYDSLEQARVAPIDIGSFADSRPRLLFIAKIIINKNSSTITDIWDERRFITVPTGASVAVTSTASLQTTYNNSPNGGLAEIITNDVNEALTIRHGDVGVDPKILELELDDGSDVFAAYTTHIDVRFFNYTIVGFDNNTATDETGLLLRRNGSVSRVSIGAADSCGSGFRCLKVTN